MAGSGKNPSAFHIPILLSLLVCEFEPALDVEEDRCPDCPECNILYVMTSLSPAAGWHGTSLPASLFTLPGDKYR